LFTGKVTADTTGSAPVGGKVSVHVCADAGGGTLALAPNSVAKF
jgi:hypothetical protein